MAEMTEGHLAGTATVGPAPVVVMEDTAKELVPVRFFDSGQPINADKDFRPGVAQAVVATPPRSVTVQPGGEPAGSPNLLDRAEAADAAAVVEVVEVVEVIEITSSTPATEVKVDVTKAPAKA